MAILSGFFVKETFGTACRLGRVFRLHKGGKSSPTYDRCNDESIFEAKQRTYRSRLLRSALSAFGGLAISVKIAEIFVTLTYFRE